jgi:hypothetical protein
MTDSNWMEVTSLTTYEVAPDGSSVKLNLLDAAGRDASLIVPLEALTTLALSMPKIFAIKNQALAQMAELMSEFHIEAFPEGLQFH